MKILQNHNLLMVFGSLSRLLFIMSFRRKISGENNNLEIHPSVILNKGIIKVIGNNNVIKINNKVRLRNTKINVFGSNNYLLIEEEVKFYERGSINFEGENSTIRIGRKTTFGSTEIFCGESETQIDIGEDCMFSIDISISTSDLHSILDMSTNKRINPPKNVIIHNKVWVGNNVYINKGAIINDNSIVAARAVVPGKEYPSNTIIAGLPAKVIKENVFWSREKL